MIPKGYCQCGCGEKTSISAYTDKRDGTVKGEPVRFRHGHGARKYRPMSATDHRRWWEENADVPYGYCWCGCGEKTPLAWRNYTPRGHVKDTPLCYLKGHATYDRPAVEDRLNSRYTVDRESGCWRWTGARDVYGYGRLLVDGRKQKAHRLMFILRRHSLARDDHLHHECGQPLCVNPDHLRVLSASEHSRLHRLAEKAARAQEAAGLQASPLEAS